MTLSVNLFVDAIQESALENLTNNKHRLHRLAVREGRRDYKLWQLKMSTVHISPVT